VNICGVRVCDLSLLAVSLSDALFFYFQVNYNWKIQSIYRGSETSVEQSRGTRDGTVCGTMDRVGWTVRSRDIYSTIQPSINVALIAEALELESVTFQIPIYASCPRPSPICSWQAP
jgi:hypothetical protein